MSLTADREARERQVLDEMSYKSRFAPQSQDIPGSINNHKQESNLSAFVMSEMYILKEKISCIENAIGHLKIAYIDFESRIRKLEENKNLPVDNKKS